MSYKEQLIRTRFDGAISNPFKATNGIRQGGVISPILFTVYVDELVKELESTGIGCNIGNKYVGCLMYADDITLICPSISGLQEMVDKCLDFGHKYSINFNDKKTMCIPFSKVKLTHINQIMINKRPILWSDSVKHLGNLVYYNLDDSHDIHLKTSEMIFSTNSLCSNFYAAPIDAKCALFKSYCTSYYGCETWLLSNQNINTVMQIKWNKCIRRLLCLPYKTHRYILPVISNIPTVTNQIHRRIAKFYNKMTVSDNELINYMYKRFINDNMSIIGNNMSFLYKNNNGNALSIHQRCTVDAIRELIDGPAVANFSLDDVQQLVNCLCCG